ncbi:MAG: riboflavin synthase [Candidatus Melainabacteria bacterium]|nr:MAG: riboflavin synthase [Candidatus Melainabacteria bacterium]
MFSGIVEEIGSVIKVSDSSEGRRLTIEAPKIAPSLKVGESVSVSGCCLTVVQRDDSSFVVEAVHETLNRSKLGSLARGSSVNLEPALRLGDRLGGHLVSGHIDTVARVKAAFEEGFSKRVTFELDVIWAPFFIEKGSVAVDGVSLTVAGCDPMPEPDVRDRFTFNVVLIPHTLAVTTFGTLKVNDSVNIETDMIARYIARWFGADRANRTSPGDAIVIDTGAFISQLRARQVERLS